MLLDACLVDLGHGGDIWVVERLPQFALNLGVPVIDYHRFFILHEVNVSVELQLKLGNFVLNHVHLPI